MTITLNHTIVPAKDKQVAAREFAQLFGLAYKGLGEHFAPLKINDGLTLLFDDDPDFESHHYAFHVSDMELERSFVGCKKPASPTAVRRGALTMPSSTIGVEAAASTSERRMGICSS
jgi:hypothetical protein